MKLHWNFLRGGEFKPKTLPYGGYGYFLEHDEKSVVRVHVYTFKPCHKKYSQSEYRKAVVYLTILQPTFPSCTVHMSHWLCWLLYFLQQGIKARVYTISRKYKWKTGYSMVDPKKVLHVSFRCIFLQRGFQMKMKFIAIMCRLSWNKTMWETAGA